MDNANCGPSPVKPKELAAAAGISASYASQILGGTRPANAQIALAAFRAFGLRLGLLAEMTEADLAKLCGEVCVHAPANTGGGAGASSGKGGAVSSQSEVSA